MPEIHLAELTSISGPRGPFIKNKERMQKI